MPPTQASPAVKLNIPQPPAAGIINIPPPPAIKVAAPSLPPDATPCGGVAP